MICCACAWWRASTQRASGLVQAGQCGCRRWFALFESQPGTKCKTCRRSSEIGMLGKDLSAATAGALPLSAGFSFMEFFTALLVQAVAGYYDPPLRCRGYRVGTAFDVPFRLTEAQGPVTRPTTGQPRGHPRGHPRGKATRQSDEAKPRGKATRQSHEAKPRGEATRRSHEAKPRGKATRQSHEAKPRGKATRQSHEVTPRGNATRQSHEAKPRGKATRQSHEAKPRGKATRQRHEAKPRGKATRQSHEANLSLSCACGKVHGEITTAARSATSLNT